MSRRRNFSSATIYRRSEAFAGFQRHVQPYDSACLCLRAGGFHAKREHFHVHSLDGFGCGRPAARPFQRRRGDFPLFATPDAPAVGSRHRARPRITRTSFLVLDAVSQAHLEIVRARNDERHELAARRWTGPSRRSARAATPPVAALPVARFASRCSKRASSSSPTCSRHRIFCAWAGNCAKLLRDGARSGTHRSDV